MRRVPMVILFAILGFIAGYFAGVSYACAGPDASNLCGLLGVFITGPIGLILGVVLGVKFGRK